MKSKLPTPVAIRVARSRQRLIERGGRLLNVRLQPHAADILTKLEKRLTTTAAIHAALISHGDKPHRGQ